MPDALKAYRSKRNFALTAEPADGGEAGTDGLTFVIQKHWASHLHYDFRLELDGTLKSWAVPKGPSYDSRDKRMAVQVEDHPIAYAAFEGTIAEKQYGAGKVIIWDKGTWQPLDDPHAGYEAGNLKFTLHGHKMHGKWVLVRMKGKGEQQAPWLLIKEKDAFARPASAFSVVDDMPDSVHALALPNEASEAAPAVRKVEDKVAVKSAARTPSRRSAVPAEARKADLPDTLSPQLATLVDKPPSTAHDWLFEIKFDGYRILARVDGKHITLLTRTGLDWSDKLGALQQALLKMALPDGWYDGEIVVHDENGRPDFGLLQRAFDGADTAHIVYFLFDAPYLNGYDMRAVPLEARRAALKAVLDKSALASASASDTVRFSDEFGADPQALVAAACKLGIEGVIGKRRDGRYVQRRSNEWIKLKCGQRQEFVIGGYTDPQGARSGFGALLLGTYDRHGMLQYAGNVGSGFNEASLRDLTARLGKIATNQSPFPPKAVAGPAPHWVQPKLVAEVSFSEWTAAGLVRHAVFQALRADKVPRAVKRETAKPVEDVVNHGVDHVVNQKAEPVAPEGRLPAGLKITSGERVIDAQSGTTKLDLVRYYALVGSLMMAHVKGRPLSLVRAPAGVGGELFFQKHADVGKLPGVKQMDQALDPEHPPMLEIGSAAGIVSAAQWNVIEFHSQNALGKAYESPNRMVFDLDPGDGVDWKAMQEAAQLVHAFLDELGLPSFLKTSGGKGLHVVVPIKPLGNWDTVKDFSQAIVRHLAATLPDRFAFKSGPRNRVGKIFIDYLRNGRGATTVAAWSARVRPGLGISVPLGWDELASVTAGDQFRVDNVHTRLDQGNAPWSGYPRAARSLTAAMKTLAFAPSK
ncbi:MAG: DNA ligase D [Massilia sp.]|nr:DNA ligase D [Massilia sp.]